MRLGLVFKRVPVIFAERGIVWRRTGAGCNRYKEGLFDIHSSVPLLLTHRAPGGHGLPGTLFGK